MSGGAFDYAHFDAQQLANTIGEMCDHADEHDYPDGVVSDLRDLEVELRESKDLLRTVEWVASGDHSPERLQEVTADAD